MQALIKVLKKTIVIALSVTLLILVAEANANTHSPISNSFASWCSQREQLSIAEQHTLDRLLLVADTEVCETADDRLTRLTTLRLPAQGIASLQPLSYFPQLQALYLYDNQITDLSSLSSLTALSTLYLDNNQIQDIEPLLALTELKVLYANNNRITSLAPLANLSALTELYLDANQITKTDSLKSLTALTQLKLGNNKIAEVAPLSQITRLAELNLFSNRITELDSLSSLSQLSHLDARDNPLDHKRCPISPSARCLFSDGAADLRALGQQQQAAGDFSAALQTFEAALAIYRQEGDRLRENDTLNQIGELYDAQEQYANALDYYQQGAALQRQLGDQSRESDTLTNLGITYIRIGQTDKALDNLQRALSIQTQLDPQARRDREGKILSGLALAYSELNQPARALRYAKQSLAVHRRVKDVAGEAIALNRVGQAYLQLGNLDKARLYLEQAYSLSSQENLGTSLARSLHNLGDFYASQGEPAQAVEKYQQAKAQWKTLDNRIGEGETLSAEGKLYLQVENLGKAVASLRLGVELWQQLPPGLTDENKISVAEMQAISYQLLQQALIEEEKPEAALEISERGRARAFAELLAHRLKLQGKQPKLEQIQPPSIQQIKAIARAQNATLVEYSMVANELYIWGVEPSGAVHFHKQALDGRSLSTDISNNRQELGIPARGDVFIAASNPNDPDFRDTRKQLYQLLIGPIADWVTPEATLIMVPQGEIFLVPFAILRSPSDRDLIEDHPLLFAPAIGLLSAGASNTDSPISADADTVLVVGDPIMPNDPATGEPLETLDWTEAEAKSIAALLNTQPLTGPAATKQSVIAKMDRASIIHFATHGLLDDFGTGVPGALALTPTQNDSGFLTAAEIFELPMSSRMVVLSACNTGKGTVTGDGVVGLSRAFLTAGVDSVVVSLWAVQDQTTALLMERFYQQLQSQPNRAIALQQAMLEIRQSYPLPYQWAAFALFGETGGATGGDTSIPTAAVEQLQFAASRAAIRLQQFPFE